MIIQQKASNLINFFIISAILIFASSCSMDSDMSSSSGSIYPMYADSNANSVNDYFEAATHDAGSAARAGLALYGHDFVDNDGDGVCDYAQDGSSTWHGPGYTDGDGDGVCDYWDEDTSMYNQGGGMQFMDQNANSVNDYTEQQWHEGHNHDYADGDGVCDFAQDGSQSQWHGPGYEDSDGDGASDHWQEGGNGHGPSMMGGAGGPKGPMM